VRRAILLLLWGSAAAHSAEPLLTVRAVDAGTGTSLDGVRCGLVEGKSKSVYARFDGRYSGPRHPREGDVLYVYRSGYDLARVVLAEARDLRVPLERCRARMEVRLAGAPERFAYRLDILFRPEGSKRDPPVEEVAVQTVSRPLLRRAIPRGMVAHCMATAPAGSIVWPVHFALRPGKTQVLRHDPPRVLRVLSDPGSRPGDATYMADRLWSPKVHPLRVDAWRWAMIRPWWLTNGFNQDHSVLRLLPDVPFHVFSRRELEPFYRHFGPKDAALDLRGPARLKSVAGRPVINGALAPEGTWLGPGRLDSFTLLYVHSERQLRGCTSRLGPLGESWSPPSLPENDWLTAWHPVLGLSHLRWRANRPPVGRTYPGVLVIRFPDGVATGWIVLFRTWGGSGRVRTSVPPLARRDVDKAGEVRFSGLMPGAPYGMDMDLEIRSSSGKVVGRVSGMRNLRAPDDPPRGRLDLRPPSANR